MLVLKILGVLMLLSSLGYGIWRFERYSEDNYWHSFFTVSMFITVVLAVGLVYSGYWWRNEALSNGGDALNGLVLMLLGSVIALGLGAFNIHKTSAAVGLFGTLLQLAIFSVLAYIGIFMWGLWVMLAVAGTAGATSVYVVNR